LIDGPSAEGWTRHATVNNVPSCGEISVSTPGVWYTVVGNGDWLKATTCRDDGPNLDFDSEMTVWRGTCNNLVCVGGNQNDDYDDCQSEAGFSWPSINNVRYYILVSGEWSPGVDPFGIQIKSDNSIPPNDLCEDALPLAVDGSSLIGNTDGASLDTVPGQSCGGQSVNSPGIWYSVRGTGGYLEATTCPDDGDDSNFDSVMTIWRGSCGNLICVDGDDDGNFVCGESTVVWESQAGVTYYILISGFGQSQPYDFGIQVKELPDPILFKSRIYDDYLHAPYKPGNGVIYDVSIYDSTYTIWGIKNGQIVVLGSEGRGLAGRGRCLTRVNPGDNRRMTRRAVDGAPGRHRRAASVDDADLMPCNGPQDVDQQWTVDDIPGNPGWVRIRNPSADCCLDIYRGGGAPYDVDCEDCDDDEQDQHWRMVPY